MGHIPGKVIHFVETSACDDRKKRSLMKNEVNEGTDPKRHRRNTPERNQEYVLIFKEKVMTADIYEQKKIYMDALTTKLSDLGAVCTCDLWNITEKK